MTVLHQAPFKWCVSWPVGPSKVVVTGTFDNWSCSTQLTKTDAGFTGTFDLPWDHKFQYKYVVDDVWKVNPAEPTERDPAGNINNVYTTPSAPPATSSVEEAKGNATSIVSYVASGLGAAFATVTGIDPINPQQIRLEDDKAKEVPVPDAQKAGPAPTAGAAQDPLVPEAPIDAKKPSDALAPIADEPVVLNLLPNTTSTLSQAATNATNAVTQAASSAATYVAETTKNVLPTAITDKLPGTATTSNGIDIPGAVEPYTEAVTSEPVEIPDAVEPYKAATNGTLPGEVEAGSTAGKLSSDAGTAVAAAEPKVSETASKLKEAVTTQKTPPQSPTNRKFSTSDATGSVKSGADGTPKKKKRASLLVKLKDALTPEKKRKHSVSASVSS